MSLFPVFGQTPAGARLQRIRQSPNYRNGRFRNSVPTEVTLKGVTLFSMLREYRNRPPDTAPAQALPFVLTDLLSLPQDQDTIVWFGHSSYLLKIKGRHILVDPVFSPNASPVSFLARAFPGTTAYRAVDMPEIDILLLTHDHYDHLDYHTIRQLIPKTGKVCTSLGVGSHLESWGMAADKIIELDWWDSVTIDFSGKAQSVDSFTFTATPARHFSGRTFKRAGTLWSSFVLQTSSSTRQAGLSLFLGGDSGFEQHFLAIGDRFGPFDLAILECGQYGKSWPYIHMLPEETAQAALALQAAALLPVHWGKFTLALHPWNEPARRVTTAAAAKKLPLAMPLIGQPVNLAGPFPDTRWWDFS